METATRRRRSPEGLASACAELVELQERFWAAGKILGDAARAGEAIGGRARAVIEAGEAVDAAGERIRSAYYPRAGRVICAGGAVWVLSPAGRVRRRVPE